MVKRPCRPVSITALVIVSVIISLLIGFEKKAAVRHAQW
jgi:hypothetical protein